MLIYYLFWVLLIRKAGAVSKYYYNMLISLQVGHKAFQPVPELNSGEY